MEQVRRGNSSCGIAIHGAPGSGKTHLIRRLRQRFIDKGTAPDLQRLSQAFAYVRLNTSASMLAQHVRRCVAADLLRGTRHGPCQLERMVISRLMEAAEGDGDLQLWWEFFLQSRLDELDTLLATIQTEINLSSEFVRVLGCLIRKQHRLDVAAWLRGEVLADAARDRLGIGPAQESQDAEELAKQVLFDFMRLAGSQVPLVLCFDQIEALQTNSDDTESFRMFGDLVANLHDADPNLVLISCLQTSRHDFLEKAIGEYAKSRLQGRAVRALNLLDAAEAIALLSRRLDVSEIARVRPADAAPLWPLNGEQVGGFVGQAGITPRKLLEEAANLFEELRAGKVPPVKTLEEWFEEEWDARMEPAHQLESPVQEILTHAVPLLCRVVSPGWKAVRSKDKVAIDHVLADPRSETRIGVKICEGQPNSLAAQLKTLANLHPQNTGLHKLVLLRDERNPISKNARKTWQYIAALEKNGAVFLQVEPETMAVLEAIRLLLADSQSGDLAFRGETVTEDQVLDWLRNNLPHSVKEFVDALISGDACISLDENLKSLQEWIRTWRIATWDEAVAAVVVGPDQQTELLRQVRERTDLFRVIDGEPTVLFSARLGRPEAAAVTDPE